MASALWLACRSEQECRWAATFAWVAASWELALALPLVRQLELPSKAAPSGRTWALQTALESARRG